MKRCKTCKWWKPQTERGHSFGVCDKGIGAVGQYPGEDDCCGDGRPEEGTGEGRTGPEFGCCHHEPKEVSAVEGTLKAMKVIADNFTPPGYTRMH